ncbi:hypothetical protein FQN57_003964 [Myotisia sp. PD_48]|nr:hypothetical protein FQN57_003964 [Myotisia sp. PD_48]
MAGHGQSSSLNPYNDTLETLWARSKKKIPFLKNDSKEPSDLNSDDQASTAKSAHSRRREQVRRAQRAHRERKEKYIKSLEQELLRLRDEKGAIILETSQVEKENKLLRDIFVAYGIAMPKELSKIRNTRQATVTVVGEPGFGQRLQVSLDDGLGHVPPVYPPGFGVPLTRRAVIRASSLFSLRSTSGEHTSSNTPISSKMAGGHAEPSQVYKRSHPYGFDATQVAVDFVLFLERCCLGHRSPHKNEFSGHALSIQAPLLVGTSPVLQNNTKWDIPASEVERLFELAGALNLDGEVTPVQAWRKISEDHRFQQLDPPSLQRMSDELVKNIKCFGFGAILEEKTCVEIIERIYASL